MATTTRIELSTSSAGIFHAPKIQESSAKKGSEVLQENHERYHCFFNADGFHNHIPHHILTLYALGASPEDIQKGYDTNRYYQRSRGTEREQVSKDLHDRPQFLKYMGKQQYYVDFLKFFHSEIETKGVEQTFQQHIFAGDEAANRMLGQLFAGFLHPIIHTGFGIEFDQPAISAEGLAMCAVSSSWLNKYFDLIHEKIASEPTAPPPDKSLFALLDEIQANSKLASCTKWSDSNKLRDGVLARAPKEMVAIASQWRISPPTTSSSTTSSTSLLERKAAEMTNFAAYMTGASQNPAKQIKMDFYFMHCINASIFFHSFLAKPWLTFAQKSKLLEMKAWTDLAMYVSRNSPKLYLDEVVNYKPNNKISCDSGWQDVIDRINRFQDDGHASKFIRALANGERVCKPYEEEDEGGEEWPVRGDMWLKLANMVVDSVEDQGTDHWARSVGFAEAWEGFKDR